MTNEKLTEVHGYGDVRRLQTRSVVRAPIETVWEALTDIEHVKKWWTDGEIGAAPGEPFRLGSPEELRGTIITLMRPHVLEFTWHDEPSNSAHPEWLNTATKGLVRIDLIGLDAETTLLTLIQFNPVASEVGASAGWHHIIETFTTYMETGEATTTENRFEELKELYQ